MVRSPSPPSAASPHQNPLMLYKFQIHHLQALGLLLQLQRPPHGYLIFIMTFFIDNKYAFRFEHPAYTALFHQGLPPCLEMHGARLQQHDYDYRSSLQQ